MQQNVAKTGWELTKVARIGRSRSLYGQKRVEGGVGQSREPKLIVCCLHNSAHPFLAKKRPGAPVFGHCPILKGQCHCFLYGHEEQPYQISSFPTLLQSGRKSLQPKCSGSCFNQLVAIAITAVIRQTRKRETPQAGLSPSASLDILLSQRRERKTRPALPEANHNPITC